ncbi:DUF6056 family protein [Latilactobacillus sakei]|uniref:DUF6056 family protein n=1 Tax=Latilactobacillus sakei TaxID=1599 RepID=UPI00050796C2|nr:DUF6056 family protein [Latilactobacillus sakei]KGB14723.1 hypothetical protein KY41_04990 [Latilactobacillus sakei]MDR7925383.1 DUF6056 family protein [Latilactobacillus sakei subsp. sakei]WEY50860.1 DUF6056 family protein [Latilactobacillus sakei]
MERTTINKKTKSSGMNLMNLFDKLLAKKLYIVLIAIFVFFSWYSWMMPLVADDFAWGHMTLRQYMAQGQFAGINDGRYIANSLMIVLAKTNIGLAFYFGGSLTLIFYLMYRILSKNIGMAGWIFTTLLLLPRVEFAQIYNYNSGFINYVSALIVPLMIILLAKEYILTFKAVKRNNWLLIGLFLLVFIFQLYSEPTTLLNIVLSLSVFIYALVKNKRVQGMFISILLGSISGAGIMFLSGAYGSVASGSDNYRNINIDLIQILKFTSSDIIPITFRNNKALIVSIMLLNIAAVIVYITKQRTKKNWLIVVLLLIDLFSGSILLSTLFYTHVALNLFISALFVIAGCSITLIRLPFNSKEWWLALCCYLSALLLISPFFLISPFGERNVFGPQLFLLLGSCIGITINQKWEQIIVRIGLLLALVSGLMFFVKLGCTTGYASSTNIKFLQYQLEHYRKGSDLAYLEVPNRKFLWHCGQEGNDYWLKLFYGFPQDRVQKVIPYEVWTKKVKIDGASKFFAQQL